MSAPTLKELIGKATPGPWTITEPLPMNDAVSDIRHGEQIVCSTPPNDCNDRDWEEGEEEANAQLIARCNPETMKAVLESLESCSSKPHSQFGIPYTDHFYDMKPIPNSLTFLFLATEKEFPFERIERILAIAAERAGVTADQIKSALREAGHPVERKPVSSPAMTAVLAILISLLAWGVVNAYVDETRTGPFRLSADGQP